MENAPNKTEAIPYGYCHCGCGKKTTIAKYDYPRYGHVKGEPKRFCRGHAARKHAFSGELNQSGLCMCGCGEPTPIAQVSRYNKGIVKGQQMRFIPGHGSRGKTFHNEGPNPSGMCMCGCGQPAPIATCTTKSRGNVQGKPVRFIHNHDKLVGPSLEERFWAKVAKLGPNDCWDWRGSENGHGYGHTRTVTNGVVKDVYAHRLSYEIHNGPIPEGMFVCHRCDNPRCVNPSHLFLGTAKDNVHDMICKGRNNRVPVKGVDCGTSKLTEEQVSAIRRRYACGERQVDLAADFSIGQSTVSAIVIRKTWKHIE